MALLPILVPLAAALAFPVAALALKRATEIGRDVWGLVLACDLAVALVFLPLLFPLAGPPEGGAWWQPVAAGAVFCIGQIAAFKSFQGELSIAIPMQGAKVLLVAFMAWLALGQSLGLKFWGAALLSVAAIHFLNEPGPASGGPRRILATSLWAGLASIAFAAFDVAMQAWSPRWGTRAFSSYAFASQAFFSLPLLAFPPRRRFRYAPAQWGWVALGTGLLAFITLGLALIIGQSGQAALVNLIFNSRCVASVIFVWIAGKWFGNREAEAGGRRTMARRLEGAALMLGALGLALG
jgi:drug/metabolite transporter (DMT)-like permease